MRFSRTFNVVGVHGSGEVGDVITGGVLDVPGRTMYEKLMHFWTKADDIRQIMMNEPRGRAAMCSNIVVPPCNPEADAGFITMESEEYPPMSGNNTICTATVLLETGMIPMKEPVSVIKLDTAAGLITCTAQCKDGKCQSVAFDNVPSFVFELDFEVDVPDIGKVKVDIAWGGMIYAIVDARSVGLSITNANGAKLVEQGEKIKRAVQRSIKPVHPENPGIEGVTILEFTEPVQVVDQSIGTTKTAVNTVVVSPGRLDRSPCGTGTCARMAVLHARGQLKVGEIFRHRSVIGSEFIAHLRGITKVGNYDAVLPTVQGSAWITGFKQIVVDPTDPYPLGFRVGDAWHMPEEQQKNN